MIMAKKTKMCNGKTGCSVSDEYAADVGEPFKCFDDCRDGDC